MDNKLLRKIGAALTILVGNTVFMALLGPRRLVESTYQTINNEFGHFIGQYICKLGEGIYIIISYGIILFIIFKLFPLPKADEAGDSQIEELQTEDQE